MARRALLPVVLVAALLTGCARARSHVSTGKPPTAAESLATEQRIAGLAHFATGVSRELTGDTAGATSNFVESARLDLGYEPLVLETARRLLRDAKQAEAAELLEKSAAKTGGSGGLYSLLGFAYYQSGKTNEAIRANQNAVKVAPEQLAGYQNLAHIYFEQKRTNDALQVLDQAAAQTEASPDFLVALAELYVRLARQSAMPEADARAKILALSDRATAQPLDNPLLSQRIGEFYLGYGETSKAEPIYQQLYKQYPDAPGVRDKLAAIYLREEKREEAARLLEEMRLEKPTDPRNYYFLGGLAFEGKNFDKAADYYKNALQLNPEFEPIYFDLAGAYIATQQPQEALEVLKKSREKFPQLSFTAEFYTGIALSQLERFQEALGHFTSAELLAKKSEPGRLNQFFYFQAGSVYERAGNIPEAVAAFRKVLELSPNNAEAMNYLGYMWAERGENLDEAKALLEKAVSIEPDNAAFIDSLAWVLHKLSKSREALIHMNRAIQLSEKPDPTLFEHLGDIQSELRDFAAARAAYQKSLELKDDAGIRQKLNAVPAE